MAQVSLSRKKELMEPDEVEVFLKKGVERVLEYKSQVIVGLIVFFAGVILASGLYYHMKNKTVNASVALGKIVSQSEGDGVPELPFAEVASKYKAFFDTYSGTRSAQFAGLRYANRCFQEGNFDEAIPLYDKALKNFSNSRSLATIIRLNLSYAYLAKKEYEKAKTHFEQVLEAQGSLVKEEALFNLGCIHDVLGEQAKRDERFREIAALEKGSIYADLVKEKSRG